MSTESLTVRERSFNPNLIESDECETIEEADKSFYSLFEKITGKKLVVNMRRKLVMINEKVDYSHDTFAIEYYSSKKSSSAAARGKDPYKRELIVKLFQTSQGKYWFRLEKIQL